MDDAGKQQKIGASKVEVLVEWLELLIRIKEMLSREEKQKELERVLQLPVHHDDVRALIKSNSNGIRNQSKEKNGENVDWNRQWQEARFAQRENIEDSVSGSASADILNSLRCEIELTSRFEKLACRLVESLLLQPGSVEVSPAPEWFLTRNSPMPQQGRLLCVAGFLMNIAVCPRHAKQLKMEVRGLVALRRYLPASIHTPLVSLVRCCGLTVLVMAPLPLSNATFLAGATVHQSSHSTKRSIIKASWCPPSTIKSPIVEGGVRGPPPPPPNKSLRLSCRRISSSDSQSTRPLPPSAGSLGIVVARNRSTSLHEILMDFCETLGIDGLEDSVGRLVLPSVMFYKVSAEGNQEQMNRLRSSRPVSHIYVVGGALLQPPLLPSLPRADLNPLRALLIPASVGKPIDSIIINPARSSWQSELRTALQTEDVCGSTTHRPRLPVGAPGCRGHTWMSADSLWKGGRRGGGDVQGGEDQPCEDVAIYTRGWPLLNSKEEHDSARLRNRPRLANERIAALLHVKPEDVPPSDAILFREQYPPGHVLSTRRMRPEMLIGHTEILYANAEWSDAEGIRENSLPLLLAPPWASSLPPHDIMRTKVADTQCESPKLGKIEKKRPRMLLQLSNASHYFEQQVIPAVLAELIPSICRRKKEESKKIGKLPQCSSDSNLRSRSESIDRSDEDESNRVTLTHCRQLAPLLHEKGAPLWCLARLLREDIPQSIDHLIRIEIVTRVARQVLSRRMRCALRSIAERTEGMLARIAAERAQQNEDGSFHPEQSSDEKENDDKRNISLQIVKDVVVPFLNAFFGAFVKMPMKTCRAPPSHIQSLIRRASETNVQTNRPRNPSIFEQPKDEVFSPPHTSNIDISFDASDPWYLWSTEMVEEALLGTFGRHGGLNFTQEEQDHVRGLAWNLRPVQLLGPLLNQCHIQLKPASLRRLQMDIAANTEYKIEESDIDSLAGQAVHPHCKCTKDRIRQVQRILQQMCDAGDLSERLEKNSSTQSADEKDIKRRKAAQKYATLSAAVFGDHFADDEKEEPETKDEMCINGNTEALAAANEAFSNLRIGINFAEAGLHDRSLECVHSAISCFRTLSSCPAIIIIVSAVLRGHVAELKDVVNDTAIAYSMYSSALECIQHLLLISTSNNSSMHEISRRKITLPDKVYEIPFVVPGLHPLALALTGRLLELRGRLSKAEHNAMTHSTQALVELQYQLNAGSRRKANQTRSVLIASRQLLEEGIVPLGFELWPSACLQIYTEPRPLSELSLYCPSDAGQCYIWGRPLGLSNEAQQLGSSKKKKSRKKSRKNSRDNPWNWACIDETEFAGKLERPKLLQLPFLGREKLAVNGVACGYRHTALIASDGRLFTFGHGVCGRLGHGTAEDETFPRCVAKLKNVGAFIVGAACGREHTVAWTCDGFLYAWGWNEAGRLGVGDEDTRLEPEEVMCPSGMEGSLSATRIRRLSKDRNESKDRKRKDENLNSKIRESDLGWVKTAACGREHTLVVTRKGAVLACGAGHSYRLGNGKQHELLELQQVKGGLENEIVIMVDGGEAHSACVTQRAEVWTWGFGGSGALGHGTLDSEKFPRKIKHNRLFAATIACGAYHTVVVDEEGDMWSWGDGENGQLGRGVSDIERKEVGVDRNAMISPIPNRVDSPGGISIAAVSCGFWKTVALGVHGKVVCWGKDGDDVKFNSQIAQPRLIETLRHRKIRSVAAGKYHVAVATWPYAVDGVVETAKECLLEKQLARLTFPDLDKPETMVRESSALLKAISQPDWGNNNTPMRPMGAVVQFGGTDGFTTVRVVEVGNRELDESKDREIDKKDFALENDDERHWHIWLNARKKEREKLGEIDDEGALDDDNPIILTSPSIEAVSRAKSANRRRSSHESDDNTLSVARQVVSMIPGATMGANLALKAVDRLRLSSGSLIDSKNRNSPRRIRKKSSKEMKMRGKPGYLKNKSNPSRRRLMNLNLRNAYAPGLEVVQNPYDRAPEGPQVISFGRCGQWKGTPRCIPQLAGKSLASLQAGGGHAIAVCTNGLVFSWGCDSHGQCARGAGGRSIAWPSPQLAHDLLSARLVTVRCGSRHSASVSREGMGYVWGRIIPSVDGVRRKKEGRKSVVNNVTNRMDISTGLPTRRCRHVACCRQGAIWSVEMLDGEGKRSLWGVGTLPSDPLFESTSSGTFEEKLYKISKTQIDDTSAAMTKNESLMENHEGVPEESDNEAESEAEVETPQPLMKRGRSKKTVRSDAILTARQILQPGSRQTARMATSDSGGVSVQFSFGGITAPPSTPPPGLKGTPKGAGPPHVLQVNLRDRAQAVGNALSQNASPGVLAVSVAGGMDKPDSLNSRGILVGFTAAVPIPLSIFTPVKVLQIAAGDRHVIAATSEGKLVSWGWSYEGALGIGDIDGRLADSCFPPRFIVGVRWPRIIAAAGTHNIVITKDECIFCWGGNRWGQIGTGDRVDRFSPTLILLPNSSSSGFLPPVVSSVAAGRWHSVLSTSEQQLFVFGSGRSLKFGFDDDRDRLNPVRVRIRELLCCFRMRHLKHRITHIAAGDTQTLIGINFLK
eukprot:g5403.t1